MATSGVLLMTGALVSCTAFTDTSIGQLNDTDDLDAGDDARDSGDGSSPSDTDTTDETGDADIVDPSPTDTDAEDGSETTPIIDASVDAEIDQDVDADLDADADSGDTDPAALCAAAGCPLENRTCALGPPVTCGPCLPEFIDTGTQCLSTIDTPTGVEASQGTSAEHVRIEWRPVNGAAGYHVYRDGVRVTDAPVAATTWDDVDAPSPPAPPRVVGVETSDDRTDGVHVTWAPATPSVGLSASWRVRAVVGDHMSDLSDEATGYRAASPILRYELQFDEVTSWHTVSGLSWLDTDAPLATLDAGTITASVDRIDGIAVEANFDEVSAGPPRSYRVRAVNNQGIGEPSVDTDGRRAVGSVSVTWEWFNNGTADWVGLVGLEGPEILDTTVEHGAIRRYAATYRADGAEAATAPPVQGYRAPLRALGDPCNGSDECDLGLWCSTASTASRCAPTPVVGDQDFAFHFVPGGAYAVGSPPGEIGRVDDREGQVFGTLSSGFFLQETEVTQAQWTALSGGVNPSCFQSAVGSACSTANQNPDGPVDSVSWWSAIAYANALSEALGLAPCYGLAELTCSGTWQAGTLDCSAAGQPEILAPAANVYACTGYRLPTEVEWEHAARAGTGTATPRGNLAPLGTDCTTEQPNVSPIAWWNCNSNQRTHHVATRDPNPWGLYDILGNVSEWTWDRFVEVRPGGTDPRVDSGETTRVMRGGSWASPAQLTRSARRLDQSPAYRLHNVGLRLARTSPVP